MCRTCGCRACCTLGWCGRRIPVPGWRRWTPPRVEKLPGVLKVVRDGSFLAVVAEREFQAIKAMRALAAAAQWQEADAALPPQADIFAHLTGLPAQDISRAGPAARHPPARRRR